MTTMPTVAGANRRCRGPFRCRGSRHESAVAQRTLCIHVGSKAEAQAPQLARTVAKAVLACQLQRGASVIFAGRGVYGERGSVRQCFWCVGDGRSGMHETGANLNIRRSNAGGVGRGQLTRLKCRPSASVRTVCLNPTQERSEAGPARCWRSLQTAIVFLYCHALPGRSRAGLLLGPRR